MYERCWCAALALSAGLLAGCGMLDQDRVIEKPRPTLVSGESATITITDDQSGSPVDLRADQKLTVRLRFAGTTHSDWTLVDFKPGVLAAVGKTRFEQDPTAAQYGEVAGTQIWRFEPVRSGQVALKFELRTAHSREPATGTANFDVTVH